MPFLIDPCVPCDSLDPGVPRGATLVYLRRAAPRSRRRKRVVCFSARGVRRVAVAFGGSLQGDGAGIQVLKLWEYRYSVSHQVSICSLFIDLRGSVSTTVIIHSSDNCIHRLKVYTRLPFD